MKQENLLFSIILVVCLSTCQGEVFTAMSDMNQLLHTEGELIRTIDNYIHTQEERLQKMKRDLIEMEKVHNLAVDSPESFVGNPLNAFLLIKRLTVDWADLQTTLKEDTTGQAMLNNLTNGTGMLQWPDAEDLNGVAVALTRLQDTYKLDTARLSQGVIQESHSAYRELTAGDCFELGRQSYNGGDHHHTMLWMNEALKKQEKEVNPSVTRENILEYLAFSTYKQGNVRQALKLTNELLEINPNHKQGTTNKVYYERSISELDISQLGDSADLENAVKKGFTVRENTKPMDTWQVERDNYEKLCRGETKPKPSIAKAFTCYLKHGPSPYLLLGPVKCETMYINPTITIFYDVLYDNEIENIKELTIPRFQRATVQNYKTGQVEVASYRISKSAWLKPDTSPQVQTVHERIGDLTDLSLTTAEELQVANYGIGGHYEPHFDYARKEEKFAFKSLGTGNRIATLLFYMTDVAAGGATVFPTIGLSLWPKKGAAAFWFNLHPNGEGNVLTRHAACPVLVGEKWVSNKWFHEHGQEFIRPCTLNVDDP